MEDDDDGGGGGGKAVRWFTLLLNRIRVFLLPPVKYQEIKKHSTIQSGLPYSQYFGFGAFLFTYLPTWVGEGSGIKLNRSLVYSLTIQFL